MIIPELDISFSQLPFADPGSRLYLGSLLSATLIVGIFYFLKKDLRGTFKSSSLLSLKSYWLSPSALTDYKIILINGFLKLLLFGPILGLSYFFSKTTVFFLIKLFGSFGSFEGNMFWFVFATFLVFIFDDFLRFFHHYLMHKVPFLWKIHQTHHSADVLTPFTLYRIHPIESGIATLRNAFSLGVSTGVLMFVFSGKIELLTILGVNSLGFLFNFTFGNIRHTHIPISFGRWERFFISPKQHQIHHSNKVEHFDKNFGVVLSCWDQLFRTHLPSTQETLGGFGLETIKADDLLSQFLPIKSQTPQVTRVRGFGNLSKT